MTSLTAPALTMSDLPSSSRGEGHGAPPAPPRRLPQVDDFPPTGPNALGDFPQRVWARLIDELLIEFPVALVYAAVVMAQYGQPEDVPADSIGPIVMTAVIVVLQFVYETLMVALWGRTLGKWMLGLKIARYSDGKKPTFAQAAMRCLLPLTGGAAGFALTKMAVLGSVPVLATAFFDPLRRGWPDKAGGTIVIRTR